MIIKKIDKAFLYKKIKKNIENKKNIKLFFTPQVQAGQSNILTKKYDFNRFSKYFNLIISKDYIYKQNIKNILQVPLIQKIVISTTSKLFVLDKKWIIPGFLALELITGFCLNKRRAKKSIANFKLRKNQLIGCKIILKGKSLYNFLDKIVNMLLPRFTDIYSINNLDSRANVTMGLKDLLAWTELENHYETFEFLRGINIVIVTTAVKKNKAKMILSAFQFPIL